MGDGRLWMIPRAPRWWGRSATLLASLAGCVGEEAHLASAARIGAADDPSTAVVRDGPDAQARLDALRGLFPTALRRAADAASTGQGASAPGWRSLTHAATVKLPDRADGWITLRDERSGVDAQVRLVGARPIAPERSDGFWLFSAAVESGDGAPGHLLLATSPDGFEDHVVFPEAPPRSELRYALRPGDGVAGLRLVDDVLELLDAQGAPRLRMRRPWVQSGEARVRARVAVEGCAVSTDPAPPWGRPVTATGVNARGTCEVVLRWEGLPRGPQLIDPEWVTTGSLTLARDLIEAAPLGARRALFAGGTNFVGTTLTYLSTADVFDVATRTFAATSAAPSTLSRTNMAAPMTDGRAIIVRFGPTSNAVNVYDPTSGRWSVSAVSAFAGGDVSLARVPNGFVVPSGGRYLLYNDVLDRWTPMSAPTGSCTHRGVGANNRAIFFCEDSRGTHTVCDPETLSCVTGTAPLPLGASFTCDAWGDSEVYCATIGLGGTSTSTPDYRASVLNVATGAWRAVAHPMSYLFNGFLRLPNGELISTFGEVPGFAPGYSRSAAYGARTTDLCSVDGRCVRTRIRADYEGGGQAALSAGFGLVAGGWGRPIAMGWPPSRTASAMLWESCNRNNRTEPGESCDGVDLHGLTCEALGFTGGTLSCSTACEFNLSGCVGVPTLDAGPRPDVPPPDVMSPDATTADVPRADVITPDVPAPDVITPDVTAPDVVAPDVITPDVTAPDVATADAPLDASSDLTETDASLDVTADLGDSSVADVALDASTADAAPPSDAARDAATEGVCTVDPAPLASAVGGFVAIETPELKFSAPGIPVSYKAQFSVRGMAELSTGDSARPCLVYGSLTGEGVVCVKAGAETCLRVSGQYAVTEDHPRVCTSPPSWRCDPSVSTCTETQGRVRVGVTYQPMELAFPLGPFKLEAVTTIGVNGQVAVANRTGSCVCAAGDRSVTPALGLTFAVAIRSAKFALFSAFGSDESNPEYRNSVELGICASLANTWRWGCTERNDVVINSGIRLQAQVPLVSRWIRLAPFQWTTGYTHSNGAWSATPRASCF